MGPDFRRDAGKGDENALLNYGFTVLRAATARAVVAAGLHPTIGLFHANRGNAFALADDLMEPFRPLVDCAVRTLVKRSGVQVDTKQNLARLIATQTVTLSNGTVVTTTPDLWGRNVGGLLEAKNVQNLSLSPQLRAQAQIARESGQPLNLVVSPRTQQVSGPLLNDVRSTGGNVFVYNRLTPW